MRAEALPMAPASNVSTYLHHGGSGCSASRPRQFRRAAPCGSRKGAARRAARVGAGGAVETPSNGRAASLQDIDEAQRACAPRAPTAPASDTARRTARCWPTGSRTAQWVRLSSPSSRTAGPGFSRGRPNGPWRQETGAISRTWRTTAAARQAHTPKPGQQPAGAPSHACRLFQYMPPSIATGANWRHRGEADPGPMPHQRVGLAGQPVVTGSQHHDDDGRPAEKSGSSALGKSRIGDQAWQLRAQQQHHQVVADHRGDTAIASTMTMPVAADSPPTKAASASPDAPDQRQSARRSRRPARPAEVAS